MTINLIYTVLGNDIIFFSIFLYFWIRKYTLNAYKNREGDNFIFDMWMIKWKRRVGWEYMNDGWFRLWNLDMRRIYLK
jgi:hypothetical protein